MAITKNAKKAHRASLKKRVFNVRRQSALKAEFKALDKESDPKKAKELLPSMYKAIDKAAKRGILKENTAARRTAKASRIAKSKAK